MGSFRQNCEITEEKNENPPFSRHGHNKALEDDINKLFESVNARLARSLDLSGPRRNPSKKPMRESGSNSPVIGFSDPVSLKQALRGLCISQAAEMATLKRLSMPPSPRISEVEKFGNIYNVVETGEQKIETPFSDKNRLSSPRVVKLVTPNASPHIGVQPYVERLENNSRESNGLQDECSASKYDVGISVVERQVAQCSSEEQPVCLQESSIVHEEVENKPVVDINVVEKGFEKNGRCEEHLVLRDSFSNHEKKIPDPNKPADVSNKEHDSSLQCRRRSKLSCGVKKVNKDGKNSGGSTIPAVKPVTINKNLVIKKLKKKGNPNARCRANNANKDTSRTLICHKCQCSLSNTVKDSHTTNGGEVVESNENPKLAEKRDISESSKSSVLDFSASTTTTATTSLSDDSCLSGPACVIRPHMSRDAKWGAINHVRKQNGFLGPTHFNLMRKLGSGDIGTVYLAELAGTGCLFAIKVMDNEFLARRKKLVRAQTEREILGILDHPFLPTLYAQFTSDNLSCLVMEFCPGGDLHVLRQKQPGQCFPEDAARFYVAEVLLALEYLHMLGIVYRDLKPENILVRGDGHIMLTDFDLSLHCPVTPALLPYSSPSPLDPPRPSGGPCAGSSCIDPFCSGPACQVSCFGPRALAKWQQKAEKCSVRQALPQLVAEPTGARSNSFVGTHEYLAPEIVRGEGHGSAVDWWTLGILLYELLYGRTPFRGPNDEGTLANVAVRELRFPEAPAVGFRARDLVRRLLVKGPEGRLGAGMGAAEIKGHPFFKGMNWALVRCGAPPWTPNDSSDGGASGDRSRFEMF